ncbi:DUF6059 family protein [Streptomyces sp. NPDC001822]|uniref:DUF6059 family protein n=1 Tax=Streptomyces sp. NPDC001822 TaxID=3364614 RepID=UPI003690C7C6
MRYVRRALREVYASLTAVGWIWLGLPLGGPFVPVLAPALTGPPDGHPERVRPDQPLTPTERALREQLMAPTGERG